MTGPDDHVGDVSGGVFDVVVVGGGINGAAIARSAAANGLRVALFEKDDFGFGTTWRSTKLIHGGLRYLEHGDVRLVRESLRERARVLQERPWLVRPQRFFLPDLPWTRRPAWQLRVGLSAYDLLALGGGLPRHRHVMHSAVEPLLPGFTGQSRAGFVFYDAEARSPERLALELVLEARALGARVLNHAAIVGIETGGGAVRAVVAQHGGRAVEVRTRNVVNAAGPWVDAVLGAGATAPEPLIGATRGTHIVVEFPRGRLGTAVVTTARTDGRVVFAVPQGHLVRIGTTDVRDDATPDAVRPTMAEVAYLLDEARTLFPGQGLALSDVRYAYAGLRPLQRIRGGPEAAISRRHAVIAHAGSGGPQGLFSVVGGKLSTFEPLATDVLRRLGVRRPRRPAGPDARDWRASIGDNERVSARLRGYGPALGSVRAAGEERICAVCGLIVGDVRHAIRSEMAATLSDVLLRRTGTVWAASRGLCCYEAAAAVAAIELSWSAERTAAELSRFRNDVRTHLPSPDELLEA